jgi:hypothetical protein
MNLTVIDLSAQQIILRAVGDTAAKARTSVISGVELIEYVGNPSSSKGTGANASLSYN